MSKVSSNELFNILSSISKEEKETDELIVRQLSYSEEDDLLAEKIQRDYERAMSRHSSYIGDLYHHLFNGYSQPYVWEYKNSHVVGNLQEDVFILSHFAPATLREGMEMMKFLAQCPDKVMMAVPHYLAKQAIKAGWLAIGMTQQMFAGELCSKVVLVGRKFPQEQIEQVQKLLKAAFVPRPLP